MTDFLQPHWKAYVLLIVILVTIYGAYRLIAYWKKTLSMIRDIKPLRTRLTMLSDQVNDLSLIYTNTAEIEKSIKDFENLERTNTATWSREIFALEQELKRREMMKEDFIDVAISVNDGIEQKILSTETCSLCGDTSFEGRYGLLASLQAVAKDQRNFCPNCGREIELTKEAQND